MPIPIEEQWARKNSSYYSTTPNCITIDRTALRDLLERVKSVENDLDEAKLQNGHRGEIISVLCDALQGHVEHPNWTAEEWLEWAEGHTDY
jgi:hypothetical protein